MPYSQTDLFPVVIEAPKPAINNIEITSQKINKNGILIAVIEAVTSTKNLPLITKEVYAKGFLRAAIEYMGNDVGAILEELKLIYARMQAIAEVNAIVADGDRPDEKQFESMVEQRLWEINYMMSGRYEIDRLQRELNNLYAVTPDADFPETKEEAQEVEVDNEAEEEPETEAA